MMSLIAEAGGERSDYFANTFEPLANNTYRLIMYPNREQKDIPKGAFLPDGRSKYSNNAGFFKMDRKALAKISNFFSLYRYGKMT